MPAFQFITGENLIYIGTLAYPITKQTFELPQNKNCVKINISRNFQQSVELAKFLRTNFVGDLLDVTTWKPLPLEQKDIPKYIQVGSYSDRNAEVKLIKEIVLVSYFNVNIVTLENGGKNLLPSRFFTFEVFTDTPFERIHISESKVFFVYGEEFIHHFVEGI